jgi:DNA-binding transcriptional LysR family regulator
MDLRHLRYVIVLAEELHFGRAARRLNISQPPLSRQLRLIENELGVQLFHRTRRDVRLTNAGQHFVREARQVVAQFEHATKVAARADRGEIGELKIGTVPTQKMLITKCVRTFAERFPDVRLEFQTACTEGQLQALHESRLQIGFLVLPVQANGLAIEPVKSEPTYLGVPESHPLAHRRRIPLEALAGEPLIMLPRNHCTGFYDRVIMTCANAGFSPRVVHEVTDIIAGMALVEAGLGMSLFPASITEYGSKGIVFRDVDPPLPRTEYALAYRRTDTSPALRAFIGIAKKLFGDVRVPAPRRPQIRSVS